MSGLVRSLPQPEAQAMALSPETIALLERAQRAIEEAKRLRGENLRLCAVAHRNGYAVLDPRNTKRAQGALAAK